MFCEKARAAKDKKSSSSSSSSNIVSVENISVLAGNLTHIDFAGVEVILLNVKSVSDSSDHLLKGYPVP